MEECRQWLGVVHTYRVLADSMMWHNQYVSQGHVLGASDWHLERGTNMGKLALHNVPISIHKFLIKKIAIYNY